MVSISTKLKGYSGGFAQKSKNFYTRAWRSIRRFIWGWAWVGKAKISFVFIM